MERYANTPGEGEASRQELIDLLFLKASEVIQSGLVDLSLNASGMCDETPMVSWYVGHAQNPDAGDCSDFLHLANNPKMFRTFDEVKCREWIDALHECLFNALDKS